MSLTQMISQLDHLTEDEHQILSQAINELTKTSTTSAKVESEPHEEEGYYNLDKLIQMVEDYGQKYGDAWGEDPMKKLKEMRDSY